MELPSARQKVEKDLSSLFTENDRSLVESKYKTYLKRGNDDDLKIIQGAFKSLYVHSKESEVAYELLIGLLKSKQGCEVIEQEGKFEQQISKKARKLELMGVKNKKSALVASIFAIVLPVILFLVDSLGFIQQFVLQILNSYGIDSIEGRHFDYVNAVLFFFVVLFGLSVYVKNKNGNSDTDHFEKTSSLLSELNGGSRLGDKSYLSKTRAFNYFYWLKSCNQKSKTNIIVMRNVPQIEFKFLLSLSDAYEYDLKFVYFSDSEDAISHNDPILSLNSVDRVRIEPISKKLLSAFWKEFDVEENMAEKLSLIMVRSYEAVCYVSSQIISEGQVIGFIDLNQLEDYCNPALKWQREWKAVRNSDSERIIYDLRMLIALIHSCTIDELRTFASDVLYQELPDNWKSKLCCEYIFQNGGRFRSLSFARTYFINAFDENKDQYENFIMLDKFRAHALQQRWMTFQSGVSEVDSKSVASSKNFDYLLDVFAPRRLIDASQTEVRDSIVGVLSPSECFDETIRFLATEDSFNRVRNSYLRGNRYATFGIILAIEYLYNNSSEADFIVTNYPSWLILKANMLRGVGIGSKGEAIRYAKKALNEFSREGESSKLSVKERISFFNIMLIIASSYDREIFSAQVVGLVEFAISNLREMYLHQEDLEHTDSREIEVCYVKFVLLTRRRLQRDKVFYYHERALKDIFGLKFENIVEDVHNLHQSLPRLELWTRYCSLKMGSSDLEKRKTILHLVNVQIKRVCVENPKSGEAMSLYLSGIKGYLYVILRLEKGQESGESANKLLYEIRDYLKEYRNRRSHIGEHTCIKPQMLITLLDRLKDSVLVGAQFSSDLVNKSVVVSLYQFLNTEVERHRYDERYSQTDLNEIDECQLVIEEFLEGYEVEELPCFEYLTPLKKEQLLRLSHSILISASRHRYQEGTENKNQENALNELYQTNQQLWISNPSIYETDFAQAFAMKVSQGMYAYPSFKNGIGAIEPDAESKGIQRVMDIVYKSVSLYVTAQSLPPSIVLPFKIRKWSKFGVSCETHKDMHNKLNRVYVPRIMCSDDYNECDRDFCSPKVSRLLSINDFGAVKPYLPKVVFVQSMGNKDSEKKGRLSKTMFESMQIVRGKDTEQLKAFSYFIKSSDSVGTMRGSAFLMSVLNDFFIDFYHPNFSFNSKNTFLALSKSWALLFVPNGSQNYYKSPMIRKQLHYMTGIAHFTILPEGLSCEDVASQLIEMFRAPAMFHSKTNTLNCYSEPNKDKSLHFICNTMRTIFGTSYVVEDEFWSEMGEELI